ncbi:hypothetical protein STRAU_2310 [Streptomyces aurantiacus JA 4570]|uniref:Uncharacterized protein n=1 Tax=Streptomyces aurantiacus JA 4570 TaxID=1286094 RepID=S4AT82_9ACTN|nr:hypothetical protein STRAU_2310 [Streptomyces aurantiacus JA 4570]
MHPHSNGHVRPLTGRSYYGQGFAVKRTAGPECFRWSPEVSTGVVPPARTARQQVSEQHTSTPRKIARSSRRTGYAE